VRRNDIAHGVVRLAWGESGDTPLSEAQKRGEYMLVPGIYMFKKYDDDRSPTYLLSSVEINRFADHFHEFRIDRIEALLTQMA
jgi:hypothetical protein